MEQPSNIVLVPYEPAWPAKFEIIGQQLAVIFPATNCAIEHIGSTAVPGLSAKPVVDIMLGAPDLSYIEIRLVALAKIGFHYVADFTAAMPERRYFVQPESYPRSAHLHAVVYDSIFWRDHLQFRDALRKDDGLAQAYVTLKLELAVTYANDSWAYADAKSSFIRTALNHARMTAKH
ncbi:MAG: GrpB family protein [Burkholderiales bacterium]